jgi:hypothetical protein
VVPWALLIRLVLRVLAGMFLWRTAASRRRGVAPTMRGRAASRHLGGVPSLMAIREGAAIGWRAASLVAFAAAAAVLLSAGVTLTVLSPRWIGIALLVLAAAAICFAAVELRIVVRILQARRRRRREQALRAQIN